MSLKSWKPKTPAGRIVRRGEAKTLQDLRNRKLEIKEPQIIDLLYPNLKEEVIKVTNIGTGEYQRKAFVVVGDGNGLIGLGEKCAANSKDAIAGAKRNARLSVFKLDLPSSKTVPRPVSGQFGPVEVKLEPMIMHIFVQPMVVKILVLAGFESVLQTGNCENSTGALLEAIFDALKN